MKRKMKKNNREFEQITILKERQKLRILEQEKILKSGLKELGDNLTGAALMRKLKENLIGGSGLAIKLGFLAASIFNEQLRRKRKRKHKK
jgi:hypothetical protein